MSDGSPAPSVLGFVDLVEIGRGGFSIVYSATQVALGRPVALKVLVDLRADSARFQREARVLGALSDIPNIVGVHEVSATDDGRAVLVMPRMEMSLARLLASGNPPSTSSLATWGIQLGRALDAAHARGIFHRDIKPENILLSARRDAFLADFGIAALVGTETGTTTAASVSPAHAAPERFTNSDAAPEAGDVYSLASTLYTALAGQPPFGTTAEGGSLGLMQRVASKPVPRIARVGMPDLVNEVLGKGLAKAPADRYHSASALGDALASALRAQPSGDATFDQPTVRVGVGTTEIATMPDFALRASPRQTVTMRVNPPDPEARANRARTVLRSLTIVGVAGLIGTVGVVWWSGRSGPKASGSRSGVTTTTAARTAGSHPISVEEAAARRIVAQRGYTADDSVGFPAGPLQAILATATGSADGYTQRVFFFHDGRFLGADATDSSAQVSFTWGDANTVAVSYTLYAADDPLCCPTQGAATVRFRWTGSRVVALDPIPPTSGDRSRE